MQSPIGLDFKEVIRNAGATMKTLARCFWGLALGWVICMAWMLAGIYDEMRSFVYIKAAFPSFVSEFWCRAAWTSVVFVILALFAAELAFRVPKIRERWDNLGNRALYMTGVLMAVMIFCEMLDWQIHLTNPSTGERLPVIPLFIAVVFCYFLILFSIVNFPRKNAPHAD